MADPSSGSLADTIDALFKPFSDGVSAVIFYKISVLGVSVPLVVIWLISAAIILTFSFGFINLRGFAHGAGLVRRSAQSSGPGEITNFQALSSALSGTVGLGNIASVPVAIALGGPGAVFWMIVAGFFGMTSKFAECALAVKYRKVHDDGTVSGGPMYYIEDVFRRRGMGAVGKIAAVFFAVMAMGASISVFQVNQSYEQLERVTGIDAPLTYGFILSALVAIVILGGIKSIGRVTRILVPGMAAVYLVAALIIIAMNADTLPGVVVDIVRGAFGFEAAGGGLIGALINGIQRATYSSEAGVGSAAIAHASVKTDEPL
ncbi:MAG: alanine:cation symporter family protein, partial [Pseudomonadota bacterium]